FGPVRCGHEGHASHAVADDGDPGAAGDCGMQHCAQVVGKSRGAVAAAARSFAAPVPALVVEDGADAVAEDTQDGEPYQGGAGPAVAEHHGGGVLGAVDFSVQHGAVGGAHT